MIKSALYVFIAISLFALPACNKIKNQTTTVVRDCTGTYIRYEGIDYRVCNLEKVAPFADGATVKTSFKKLKECNGSGDTAVVCAMLHENGGWINVDKITGK